MKKVLFFLVVIVATILFYKQCTYQPHVSVVSQSQLIEKQIRNVGKLVVSEGYFSEVFSYEDSKEIFGSYFTADKKALVIANTEVTVAYDLSELRYEIDSVQKTLRIIEIPEEEISIYPEFEYYDIQADFFNPFEAKDYNTIKDAVSAKIKTRIEDSKLKSNANNRLMSELSKFFIITQSMGWTLEYNTQIIRNGDDFIKMLP